MYAPQGERFRVSRARLHYTFERYAIADELLSVGDAAAVLGVSREVLALLVLRGMLAVADSVHSAGEAAPPRKLLRSEVEALRGRVAASLRAPPTA